MNFVKKTNTLINFAGKTFAKFLNNIVYMDADDLVIKTYI
jgi:hypothetical protein